MAEKQYYTDIISGLAERTIKRLWIVIILLIVLLVATNAMWIYRDRQFTTEVTETYTSEADGGGLAIVNRDGSVVNYGESDLYSQDETSSQDGR